MWKKRKGRIFWKYFSSYIILILLPAISACFLIYTYLVSMMDSEVEKSDLLMLQSFSQSTDKMLFNLREDMVQLAGSYFVGKFSEYGGSPQSVDQVERVDTIKEIYRELATIENAFTLSHAFLYFPQQQLVIDKNGISPKDTFFTYRHVYKGLSAAELEKLFTGKHRMTFTPKLNVQRLDILSKEVTATYPAVSLLMSYPIASDSPEVYLVADLQGQSLQSEITLGDEPSKETAILDVANHSVIALTPGYSEQNVLQLESLVVANERGSGIVELDGTKVHVSYVSSRLNNWYYVTLTELAELRSSANLMRTVSVWFLLGFTVIGLVVSNVLSRRMALPIYRIKSKFELMPEYKQDAPDGTQDELHMISKWSNHLLNRSSEMEVTLRAVEPIIHEHFVGKVVTGEWRNPYLVQQYAKEIGFNLYENVPKCVVIIELLYDVNAHRTMSVSEKTLHNTELRSKIAAALPERVWFTQPTDSLLVCVIRLMPEGGDGTEEALQIQKILQPFSIYFRSVISVGAVALEPQQLYESYCQAADLLENKPVSKLEQILTGDGWKHERSSFDGCLTQQELGRITNLVKTMDRAGLARYCCELLDDSVRKQYTLKETKELARDMLNALIREGSIAAGVEVNLETYPALLEQLSMCVELEEFKLVFSEACGTMLTEAESKEERSMLLEQVTAYIHEHYAENLGLEQFARQLGMSMGHFSRIFKDYTSEKFVDYVAKVRLNKAKELLKETGLNMEEVAGRVGFISATSFITTFKKYEGITPGKFRTLA
ncbi:helix-turn-helix transcriptional regulator [Paenibacillus whitsoniae]|uniref:AraC family transcriptional regulator n=1 Tax=Paenibacillus whitsoniae TaxID=2496558 RepID=A0A430JIM9_9BACL|nr:AraC family transcriptional regulator [Paenibacillus whitsoniae]RTE10870.1 AraC family transcriptional regulator [Paenibacillus whitsoniae]